MHCDAMHLYMLGGSKGMLRVNRGQNRLLKTKGNIAFKRLLRGLEGAEV